ncbi:MAG TPA: hypothetical protein VMS17_18225 [Gemmataceae bacterium]|nr:hypothetical protein [Gemmataceae bacterium]
MNSAASKSAPPTPPTGPFAAWTRFWFAPADPIALGALRVLGGLLFLFWLLPFAGRLDALFGLNGWFDARAYHQASHLQGVPPHMFSWSILYLCGTSSVALTAVYWLSMAMLILFTLGLWTRVTGLLTYVIVVSFTANPAVSYDADALLVMLAFYLMLGHLFLGLRRPGQPWAERILGPKETWLFDRRGDADSAPAPSLSANLAVRLLQVHFAIAMLAGGLLKLQGPEWWSGVAPWFYLHPPLQASEEQMQSILAYAETYRGILSLIAYAATAWQIAFPAFAWRRRWRPLLLGGAALAWLTDACFFGLPLLGPIMVMGCLSYLVPEEWRRLATLLGRLPGLRRLQHREAAAPPARGREARNGTESAAMTGGQVR